jgi:anti-anti-sigma factor
MEEEIIEMVPAVEQRERAKLRKDVFTWPIHEITGANCRFFRNWIMRKINIDVEKVVIDLSGVSYVNAAGLAAMVHVNRFASGKGIHIEWKISDQNVRKLLALTKLDSIFEVR